MSEVFKSFIARAVLTGVLASLAYVSTDVSSVADPLTSGIVVALVAVATHAVHAMLVKYGGPDDGV